jgi:hypothetical protein
MEFPLETRLPTADEAVDVLEPNLTGLDPASVEREVQSMRRRPLLTGVLALALIGFGIWYMTGGSATGSPHQAEQLVIAHASSGGLTAGLPVQTVHCTQQSQGVFAKLTGLFSNSSGRQPNTVYACSGTSTTGVALAWCVAFPPRSNRFGAEPWVSPIQPGSSCPSS